MKCFLLALLTVSAACAAAPEEDNGVLVLTNDNFQEAVDAAEFMLVEFYAPWCGHCKALAPEYEKAAAALKEKGSNIKLAKVDATIEKDLGTKFEIKGFPTLKFFKSGNPVDYNGPREADGIVAWCEKKSGPPAQTVSSADDAAKLAEDNEVVVFGLFKDADSDAAKEFTKAADTNDDQVFAISSEQSVFDKYEVKKDSAVVLIKKFDEGRNDYDGDMKAEDLNKWCRANAIPLINDFSQETAPVIFGSDIKVHFLLIGSKESKDLSAWKDAMTPAAKANKGKIIFVHIDSDAEDNAQVLEFFGLKAEDTPKYIIYAMEDNAKYMSESSGVVEKEVTQFVSDYFDGKLKKTLKSEALPEDWDAKPVKVLVSSNFQEVAMDKKKDVFVEFYAPWCGHCKALEPKWNELAEHFKDSDDIVIAKMDSTANEIDEVQVEGFPTLKLFKKETNEIVDYKGKRETEDMIKFLETGEGGATEGEDSDSEDEDYDDEDEDAPRDEL